MKTKKQLSLALACIFLSGAAAGCGKGKDDASKTDIFATEEPVAPVERYVTVSAAGNVTLAANINPNSDESFAGYAKSKGSKYFFENALDFFSDDDITIANLDCVISDDAESTSENRSFRADKDYTDILTDGGIDVVNLANEHTQRFGSSGLSDTKAALDEAGITWCADGEPTVAEYNGVKVGFIGVYVEDEDYTAAGKSMSDSFEALDEDVNVIIVSLHWGESDSYTTAKNQTELAHDAVDLGANLVLGTHPYPIQGIEKYNGSVICYSLGNFCYGGGQCPEDYKDSFIFRQTFTLDENGDVIDDDCYEIVPFNVSSSESRNNFQPTPAEGKTRFPRIKQTITKASDSFADNDIILYFNDEYSPSSSSADSDSSYDEDEDDEDYDEDYDEDDE